VGYFSNLTVEYIETYEDNSYPSPDRQFMWRFEDLQSRLEELIETGESRRYMDDGLRLTDNEIRYAIPERFHRIVDLERAIDLAARDICLKYGIDVAEKPADNAPVIYSIHSFEQLCFDGLSIAESYDEQQEAA